MPKELFTAKINGIDHTATREKDDDGTEYVLVKANNKEQRFSPTYSAEELKYALSQPTHSPQAWEVKQKEGGK